MVVEIDKRNNMVVLSLGGNIGDVGQAFKESIKHLSKCLGEVNLMSSIYLSQAWGIENQPDFLNQVITINTQLAPQEVLRSCLDIEEKIGRNRIDKIKWKARVIDIDILFYEDKIINSEDLVIPHPYIQDRNFVLSPLAEIIPDFMHPTLKKTVLQLKKSCADKLQVIKSLD